MAKEYSLSCSDAGMKCDYVARGSSKGEVLDKIKEHAAKVHGYTEIKPEDIEALSKKIKVTE